MSNFIGQNIKFLRKKRNMTQQELANYLDTTKQNIYKYESNKVTPPVESLVGIADFLSVSLNDLVKTNIGAVMNKAICLNKDVLMRHRSILTPSVNETSLNYKLTNRIHFLNLKKKNTVISEDQGRVFVEYLKSYDEDEFKDFVQETTNDYQVHYKSAIFHTSDTFLTVEEFNAIANTLGTEIGFEKNPGTLNVNMNDDFLTFIKLLAYADKNNTLTFSLKDTLLSMIDTPWDNDLTSEGLQVIEDMLNTWLNKTFDSSFDFEKIEENFDALHLLAYIHKEKTSDFTSIEGLYQRFNDDALSFYDTLRVDFMDGLIKKINNELFSGILNIKIDLEYLKQNVYINGYNSHITKAMTKNESLAYYNYLLSDFLRTSTFENMYIDYLKKYLKDQNIGLLFDHLKKPIKPIRKNPYQQKSLPSYKNFLNTGWLTMNKGYLDSKSLQLIKKVLMKEIKEMI